MKNECVDIMMATYNGKLYVREQIDSILSQSYSNWKLYIRDDGSTDDTVTVLEEYCKKDDRVILIKDSKGCLRISDNFRELLHYSSSSYIMFADQDDIWFVDKIEKSLNCIKDKEGVSSRPILFFCNAILVNSDMSKILGLNYPQGYLAELRSFLFYNAGFQGASMMFNRSLYELLEPFMDDCKVHDYHVSLVGLLLANVYYMKTPLLYYRRHSLTATNVNKSIAKRILSFLKGENVLFDERLVHYLQKFVESRKSGISIGDLSVIASYLKIYTSKSKISRIVEVYKSRFLLRNSCFYLWLKILIIG